MDRMESTPQVMVSSSQRYEEMVKRVRFKTESIEVYYHDKVAKARACVIDDEGTLYD